MSTRKRAMSEIGPPYWAWRREIIPREKWGDGPIAAMARGLELTYGCRFEIEGRQSEPGGKICWAIHKEQP
jgi:hypothetical protein